MAKRGYKLQEFLAHGSKVNCLNFGKKNCRVFITGGDDQKVNLWSVGKPTSVASLCGHTSPVESAAFDTEEVLVVAGSSSGAIKLWELEETKLVRTLAGHRSYCTAVEFHPFGEFFASGSMDTNLKIWDIRKKGCIHTYKGHTRGISKIRFTPDGRWVVSGGFDDSVKIWDLTAGKLLHDFKFHEGHIRSIEFHPLEFLLATGSADKTVKFWDLETFEMIGSSKREATGVRSIAFHPDGRTLFCGLHNSLKVYSWEPVICHDSVDMGWSTLGDLCVHDGKLLGGAYYENSVAIWVADVSLMEPYDTRLVAEQYSHSEQKCDSEGRLSGKEEILIQSKSNIRPKTPDIDSKEIKTIYVDCVKSVSPKTVYPIDVPKVVPTFDSKEINAMGIKKRSPAARLPSKSNPSQIKNRSIIIPSIVPRDDLNGKDSVGSRRESIASAKASRHMSVKLSHRQTQSGGQFNVERMSVSLESVPFGSIRNRLGRKKDTNVHVRVATDENARESSEGKLSSAMIVAENTDQISSLAALSAKPSHTRRLSVSPFDMERKPVSLESGPNDNTGSPLGHTMDSNLRVRIVGEENGDDSCKERQLNTKTVAEKGDRISSPETATAKPSSTKRLSVSPFDTERISVSIKSVPHDNPISPSSQNKDSDLHNRIAVDENAKVSSEGKQSNTKNVAEKPDRTSSIATMSSDQTLKSRGGVTSAKLINGVAIVRGRTRSLVEKFERGEIDVENIQKPSSESIVEPLENPVSQVEESSICIDQPKENYDKKIVTREESTFVTREEKSTLVTRVKSNLVTTEETTLETREEESTSKDDSNAIENLIQNHDVLLSTFRSRLTRLQVVRHFWGRNDFKGAVNALRKFPDHSVQVDVVGVLIERLDVITLDIFACLLPVLLGLLDSKVERHTTTSLEMLLKLVAVFGTIIRSTVSAPPAIGVDLHAEERRECCKQCFAHLQDMEKMIPELVRRGSFVARTAQQLNLVLQQT